MIRPRRNANALCRRRHNLRVLRGWTVQFDRFAAGSRMYALLRQPPSLYNMRHIAPFTEFTQVLLPLVGNVGQTALALQNDPSADSLPAARMLVFLQDPDVQCHFQNFAHLKALPLFQHIQNDCLWHACVSLRTRASNIFIANGHMLWAGSRTARWKTTPNRSNYNVVLTVRTLLKKRGRGLRNTNRYLAGWLPTIRSKSIRMMFHVPKTFSANMDTQPTILNTAVSCLRRSVAVLPPRRHGFNLLPVYVGLVVVKQAVGHVFSPST